MMISNDNDIRKSSEFPANVPAGSRGRKINVPDLPMQAPVKNKNALSRKIHVPELPMQSKSKKEKVPPKRGAFLSPNIPRLVDSWLIFISQHFLFAGVIYSMLE